MTVLEFIESKGWKYKLSSSGKEATLETCPYCHDNHWRFNVNLETGQYICNRQNNCGAKGVFKLDKKESKKSVDMDKLRDKFSTLSKTQLEYLKGRGISEKTAKEMRVLNRSGVLCFFYTDINGKATGVKYRSLEKKIWSENNSDMTLLNWDRVPKDAETLICTEGEVDMMSAYEVGFKNVVSIPNGTKSQEWIEKHYTWLERFKTIVLCLDNDQAGQEAIKQIADRLSDLKAELKTVDLLFYKDLNEVLQDDDGATKLKNILTNNIKDLELSNTYILSQIKCEDDVRPIDTGDDAFNRLTGGLRFGEVWIFTGNAGSGKSTFLNNIMANILNQGYSVYTHQGEFKPSKFKTNLYKIMSRPNQIETYKNEFKSMVYGRVSKSTEEQIDEWLGDRLIIHGSQVPKKNELIKTMEQMYKRNGIKFFFIDNLMTIGIDGEDKYEQQKLLFLELQEFAKKYNVFVGVVAHPKKNNLSLEEVDQYIIHGGSEIPNLTNFIIILKRLNDAEKEKLEELDIQATIGGCCLKDREYGDVNKIEYWDFEKKTGRFLSIRNKDFTLNKKYKWEDYQEIKAEFENDDDLPF